MKRSLEDEPYDSLVSLYRVRKKKKKKKSTAERPLAETTVGTLENRDISVPCLRTTLVELRKKKGSGILFDVDGSLKVQHGSYDLDRLYEETKCDFVQMVPCTVSSKLAGFNIWCDENGRNKSNVQENKVATRLLGNEVYGRNLYGPILLLLESAVE